MIFTCPVKVVCRPAEQVMFSSAVFDYKFMKHGLTDQYRNFDQGMFRTYDEVNRFWYQYDAHCSFRIIFYSL